MCPETASPLSYSRHQSRSCLGHVTSVTEKQDKAVTVTVSHWCVCYIIDTNRKRVYIVLGVVSAIPPLMTSTRIFVTEYAIYVEYAR